MSKELFEVVDREDGTVLSVESNFFDWNKTKARKENYESFYLSLTYTYNDWNDVDKLAVQLNINDAKELVSFLQEKIEFLEKDEDGLDKYVEAKREMKDIGDLETLDVYDKEIYVKFDSQMLYDEMGHNRFQELIKNMINADMNIRANTPFRLVGIQKHKLPNREPMYDLVFIDGNREHKMKESLLSIV